MEIAGPKLMDRVHFACRRYAWVSGIEVSFASVRNARQVYGFIEQL